MREIAADVAWLEGPRKLVFKEELVGAPGPHELLCRTVATVISPGTEIAAWTGMPPLRPGPIYPRLQGYCNVAEVLNTGSGVTTVAAGMRVLSFTSHRTHFNIAEDDILFVLEDWMDATTVASTYLFHLGYNSVLRSGVRAGSRVLVVGLGALGLTSVAMAHIAGADVRAISSQDRPAELAKVLGASGVHGREGLSAIKAAWGNGADVVISTTGGWDDWRLSLDAARKLGTIAVLGFPGRGMAAPDFNPLDSQYFYDKQLRIEAVGMSPDRDVAAHLRFNQRDNIAYLARLVASGRVQANRLISGTWRGAELASAYDALVTRTGSPVTFALDWAA
jgi:threonine dehydrogenase-like Zn-dependent dehydrogenase